MLFSAGYLAVAGLCMTHLLVHAVTSSVSCPCLALDQTLLGNSAAYDVKGNCLRYENSGSTYCFPLDYGLNECKAHDQGLEPFCNKKGFPGSPDWCGQSWCWVDARNCDFDNYDSSFWPDLGLRYSYSACGATNTFSSWIGDGVSHAFADLVALVERYVVGVKLSLESEVDAIQSFVSDESSVATDCQPNDSCRCSTDCNFQECWGLEANFFDTNLILKEELRDLTDNRNVNFIKCAANSITSSYLQVSGREYNDENRVAYQYFGDQATGAMVQWPETYFCPDDFDARFRPWYAAAASGSKDIVIVVDTSSSMSGKRLAMAKAAIKQVVKTLTWVDYVNVLTFNSRVNRQYHTELVPAEEQEVDRIIEWADRVVASGGTDFMEALTEAYLMLDDSAKNPDRTNCAQAILFLADGTAGINQVEFTKLKKDQPNVVIFSYALGENSDFEPLQQLACDTNGVFYPVLRTTELPELLTKYYEYYIKLQDTCKLSWIKYSDAGTGSTLVAGCSPVFNYDETQQHEPSFVGVTCQDLNTIVALEQLESCTSGGFKQFIDQIRQEASTCSAPNSIGANGKITNSCVLQELRESIAGGLSTCPKLDSVSKDDCTKLSHPANSSCNALNPDRFRTVILDGCADKTDLVCAASLSMGAKIAIVVVGALILTVTLSCFGNSKMVTYLDSVPQAFRAKYANYKDTHVNKEDDDSVPTTEGDATVNSNATTHKQSTVAQA